MMKPSQQLFIKEEIANSISHGIGSIAMLILLPIAIGRAYHMYDTQAVVGFSIFIISLFLMFLSSTIYHSMSYDTIQKKVLRIIDHSMIYVAIAGSYTPIALSLIGGLLGYIIIATQWSITLFGILYKSVSKTVNEKISLLLYLTMGWLAIFIIPIIIQKTTIVFTLLLSLGGICYTIGAIFYAIKKPYTHIIWHLFILLASLLQFIAIVYFMI